MGIKFTLRCVFFVLLTSLLLLGRFSWDATELSFSLRSYLANLYLSLIFLPTLYLGLKHLLKEKTAQGVWVFFFILYTLPYRWLGLNHFFYPLHLVNANATKLPEAPDWFFKGYHFPTLPYEVPFFLFLFFLGLLLIALFFKKNKFNRIGAVFLWLLILLQTWMHLSLRSPYTYIPHYERSQEAHYWYHYYLTGENSGAVNLDYHAFRPAEELFFSKAQPLSVLATRAVPQYIAASFTYFFNSYYVFLVLNCLLWLLACKAFYFFASKYFSSRVATLGTVLFASAEGLILYVAQPKMYVFGITGSIFMLSTLVYCFKEKKQPHWILFGSAIGLILLCYDAEPWIPAIFLFALLDKYDLKKVFFSLLLAFAIHRGFMSLCKFLPELIVSETLAPVGGHPIDNLLSQLKNHEWASLLSGVERSFRGYLDSMRHAFQWVCVPAVLSLFLVKNKQKKLLAVILLPSILTYSLFEMGKSFYIQFPRLVYSSYPAVYLFAALALAGLWDFLEKKGFKTLGRNLVFLLLVLNFVWLNLDSFGYPHIYYFWFYR